VAAVVELMALTELPGLVGPVAVETAVIQVPLVLLERPILAAAVVAVEIRAAGLVLAAAAQAALAS
jgi:hypothetical protein